MTKTPEQIVNHILSGNKKLNIDKWSKAKKCVYCEEQIGKGEEEYINGKPYCASCVRYIEQSKKKLIKDKYARNN